MSMRDRSDPGGVPARRDDAGGARLRHHGTHVLRTLAAALLGLAAALLVSCGSSGKGLIPSASAGPLQSDFEAVSQAAQSGNGDCTQTETAIAKTEQDFAALPRSINAGLRSTLQQGISNLRSRALVLCAQPTATVTTGTTATTRTNTTNTSATTPTITTPTTPTQATTTTTPATPPAATTESPGGGTPAPGGETPATGGAGSGQGEGRSGGVSPGGNGPPGQEGK
jgi:hypothetical protein